VELLKEFQKDSEPIVSQSCDVALCMVDLERSGKPFEVCFLFSHSRTLGQFNYISLSMVLGRAERKRSFCIHHILKDLMYLFLVMQLFDDFEKPLVR
jgi:hypothetical protein